MSPRILKYISILHYRADGASTRTSLRLLDITGRIVFTSWPRMTFRFQLIGKSCTYCKRQCNHKRSTTETLLLHNYRTEVTEYIPVLNRSRTLRVRLCQCTFVQKDMKLSSTVQLHACLKEKLDYFLPCNCTIICDKSKLIVCVQQHMCPERQQTIFNSSLACTSVVTRNYHTEKPLMTLNCYL